MKESIYDATKKQFTGSQKEVANLELAISFEPIVTKTYNKIIKEMKLEKSSIFIIDFIEEWIFAIDGHPQGVEDFDNFVDDFRGKHGEKQLALLVAISNKVFQKLREEFVKRIDLRVFKITIALIKAKMYDEIRRKHDNHGSESDSESRIIQ